MRMPPAKELCLLIYIQAFSLLQLVGHLGEPEVRQICCGKARSGAMQTGSNAPCQGLAQVKHLLPVAWLLAAVCPVAGSLAAAQFGSTAWPYLLGRTGAGEGRPCRCESAPQGTTILPAAVLFPCKHFQA